MGKRIVIGLLAVVVIGVLVFFVSQPKRGSVEWHKREYRKSWGALGGDWRDRVRSAYSWLIGADPSQSWDVEEVNALHGKAELHRDALLAKGYLARRAFPFSNVVPTTMLERLLATGGRSVTKDSLRYTFILCGTNDVIIIAPAADIGKWREVVGKVDVP
jgi:hypothetical protein